MNTDHRSTVSRTDRVESHVRLHYPTFGNKAKRRLCALSSTVRAHSPSRPPKEGSCNAPGWDVRVGLSTYSRARLSLCKVKCQLGNLEKTDDIQLILPKRYDFTALYVTNQFCISCSYFILAPSSRTRTPPHPPPPLFGSTSFYCPSFGQPYHFASRNP